MKQTTFLFKFVLFLSVIVTFTACESIDKAQNTENGSPPPHGNQSPTPKNILRELNAVRTNPKAYAFYIIKPRLNHFNGKIYTGGTIGLITQEGVQAVQECISVLNTTAPMEALSLEKGLNTSAQWFANDQSATGVIGHTGSDGSTSGERMNRYGKWSITCGENCAYGSKSAREIVVQLLIDDGVSSRGHRKNILNPAFKKVGIGFSDKNNAPYGAVSVMDLAGGYTSN